MVFKDRLLRWWTYFRRGHNTYLVFLLSFANFVTIQYRLLVEYVPALKILFINFTSFLLAFAVIYLPIAVQVKTLSIHGRQYIRQVKLKPS